MQAAFSTRCDGNHTHKTLLGRNLKDAENYPEIMAATLAQVLMEPAGPNVGEEFSYPVDDATLDDMEARDTAADPTPKLKLHHDLREKHGVKVFSYVRRLHKNMGPPRPTGADEDVARSECFQGCARVRQRVPL